MKIKRIKTIKINSDRFRLSGIRIIPVGLSRMEIML